MNRFILFFSALFLFISFSTSEAFERTKIDSSIFVNREEIFVHEEFGGALYATHALYLMNESGKSVNKDIVFNIDNFKHLKVMNGQAEIKNSDSKMKLTLNLVPGQNELIIGYVITGDSNRFPLELSKNIFTKTSYILTPTEKFQIEGSNVEKVQETTIQDQSYSVYMSTDILPAMKNNIYINRSSDKSPAVLGNAKVSFHPAWLIRFWKQSPFASFNPHIVLAFVVLMLVVLIVYKTKKNQKIRKDESGNLSTRKEEIIRDIYFLDEQYKNGEIGENTYHLARAELKRAYADEN